MYNDISNINNFNENEITPLFTNEIPPYLAKRKNIAKYISNQKLTIEEKNISIYNKTLEYMNIFSKLEGKKINILRKIINNKISTYPKEMNKNLEIQFIMCKIIDLMPISFEEIMILIPNFITLFSIKDGKSLIDTIVYIIKN
jgi:DNA-directed RNA polymerase subunit F